MEYEKLVFTLNKIEEFTKDKEIKNTIHDLNWEIKKGGISGLVTNDSIDSSGAVDFMDLMKTIAIVAEKSDDRRIKKILKSAFNNLSKTGIDGFLPSNKQKNEIRKYFNQYLKVSHLTNLER